MAKDINIDNIRYSMEHQEYFQRQLEVVVNALVNQSNDENAKAFAWFMNMGNKNLSSWNITNSIGRIFYIIAFYIIIHQTAKIFFIIRQFQIRTKIFP